jgi:hypothetical protein
MSSQIVGQILLRGRPLHWSAAIFVNAQHPRLHALINAAKLLFIGLASVKNHACCFDKGNGPVGASHWLTSQESTWDA